MIRSTIINFRKYLFQSVYNHVFLLLVELILEVGEDISLIIFIIYESMTHKQELPRNLLVKHKKEVRAINT